MKPAYYVTYLSTEWVDQIHKHAGEVVWFDQLFEAQFVAQNMRHAGTRGVHVKELLPA